MAAVGDDAQRRTQATCVLESIVEAQLPVTRPPEHQGRAVQGLELDANVVTHHRSCGGPRVGVRPHLGEEAASRPLRDRAPVGDEEGTENGLAKPRPSREPRSERRDQSPRPDQGRDSNGDPDSPGAGADPGRGDEEQPAHELRVTSRKPDRDLTAEGVACDVGGSDAELLEGAGNGVHELGQPDSGAQRGRSAVAGQVERDDAVAESQLGATSTQFAAAPPRPWSSTTGGPAPRARARRWAGPAARRVADVTPRQYPEPCHVDFREAGPLTPAVNIQRRAEPERAWCAGGLF